ncbi:MAG: rhodanese-like domain-containing protein [Cloacibacillus sp.]
MKRFLMIMLAAAIACGSASAFAAETAPGDDPSSSILSQVKNNKENNKANAAPSVKSEDKKPEAQKAPAEEKKNPAAEKAEAIAKYEASKAAKENEKAANNKNTAAQSQPAAKAEPAKTAPTKTTAPAKTVEIPATGAAVQPVKTPAAKTEPAKAEPAKIKPMQTAPVTGTPTPEAQKTAPAASPAAQPATAGEVEAGRPLNPSPMQPGEPETEKSLIVDVDWLKANLNNVILIDARPESLYAGGHIPGAVNAPWTYFANMAAKQGTEKWGVVWAPATMAKRVGALGVNGKKTVVAYADGAGWGQNGYVVWVLRQAGVKNAKMLVGGIGAWKNAGGKIVKNRQSYKAVPFTIKQYVSTYTATTEWINNNLGKPGLVIIDVRTEPEYLGKIRPFQEKRAGHLPGALNIPRESFQTPESTVKSPEDITAMLAASGITPENEIIIYDTAGVRGAYVTMVLRLCGFTKSQNYDEGFQAWAGNPELPLVKP